MELIIIESRAFYELLDRVVAHVDSQSKKREKPKWIGQEQAMEILQVKSPTTMQSIRDNGKIRYTQPRKKIILYDRDSLMEYLDREAREVF
ncbi:MAG: hypothetical protein ACI85I_001323 [Arenicella sp.]|jgi:hypothetical protein